VIRRGFWLVLGATLGVAGYRRASRVARSLVPAPREPVPGGRVALRPPQVTGAGVVAGAARAGRYAAEGAAFVRDVRDGVAEYLDRQDPEVHRTLGSQQGPRGGGQPAP
jgi:hypothetical protein